MWADSMPFLRNSSAILHKKRKGESLMEIMPPLKMHINEEKMVSQLKGIHLSNSYTSHGSTSTKSDSSFLDYILDNTPNEVESLPSLKLCDELKSQFNPSFKFNSVPNSILERFNKECTAVVLWQPPVSSISRTLSINGDQPSQGDKALDPASGTVSVASTSAVQQNPVDVEMLIDDDDNNNSMRENSPIIIAELQSPSVPF